jgi:hypothetical protein
MWITALLDLFRWPSLDKAGNHWSTFDVLKASTELRKHKSFPNWHESQWQASTTPTNAAASSQQMLHCSVMPELHLNQTALMLDPPLSWWLPQASATGSFPLCLQEGAPLLLLSLSILIRSRFPSLSVRPHLFLHERRHLLQDPLLDPAGCSLNILTAVIRSLR